MQIERNARLILPFRGIILAVKLSFALDSFHSWRSNAIWCHPFHQCQTLLPGTSTFPIKYSIQNIFFFLFFAVAHLFQWRRKKNDSRGWKATKRYETGNHHIVDIVRKALQSNQILGGNELFRRRKTKIIQKIVFVVYLVLRSVWRVNKLSYDSSMCSLWKRVCWWNLLSKQEQLLCV